MKKVLHPIKEPINGLMKFMGLAEEQIATIEIQYNEIHLINWTNNKENDSFWSEVSLYKGASRTNPFEELSQFAVSSLMLPHSNAEVQSVFSAMNNIK